jgi:hypothetical protein
MFTDRVLRGVREHSGVLRGVWEHSGVLRGLLGHRRAIRGILGRSRVLRGTVGPNREKIIGKWKKLHKAMLIHTAVLQPVVQV